jgi:hypothetical protein
MRAILPHYYTMLSKDTRQGAPIFPAREEYDMLRMGPPSNRAADQDREWSRFMAT